jgi:hypothetical protein
MKLLETTFSLNDLPYTLLKRNDKAVSKVVMYETRQENDMILCHYEVASVMLITN